MSFVTAQPEILTAAAGSLSGIGDAMTTGMTAAAAPTTGVLPPAADMVSAMTAAQFSAHAQMFQQVSAQAAAVHQQIVATLSGNSNAYALTEAANASSAG
ncbi:PE family protein [[Mycobacterium] nativiensis]|uniref:PE family protein n=1 Tax=[Mycobacterium] nativiensis TaxID=2855503 RepID=A0ABU5XTF1_9MYCO|nr:PE family protein [Mycolicibacter sp. MYC340]MEB3031017.1 PE family protein [Mycolicibacter sp. MYC340]